MHSNTFFFIDQTPKKIMSTIFDEQAESNSLSIGFFLPSLSPSKKQSNKCKCLIFNLAFVLVPVLRAIFFCWSKSLYMLRIVCVCVNRRIKYVSCLRWVWVCVRARVFALWVTNCWFHYCRCFGYQKPIHAERERRIYNVLEHFTLGRVRSTVFTFFIPCAHSLSFVSN